MNPLISIIIPAYNCQSTIAAVLQSVLDQTYSNIEVIIIDDGSTDETGPIVKSIPNVKYFYQDNAGPATARNRGAKEAMGSVLFFTDSDCIAHKDWIEQGLKCLQLGETQVVAGSYGIANPESFLARCIWKEIVFRHRALMRKHTKSFGSYNFGIKAQVFQDVGGFNESYRFASGEDNDLSYRICQKGYKICFSRNVLVDHFHPVNVNKYLKEQFRHGFWRVKMYQDFPNMAKGDNYTFWKDIFEMPLAGFCLLTACIAIWDFSFGGWLVFILTIGLLIVLQVSFAKIMMESWKEVVFYAWVMFLRVFARAFGLSTGIAQLVIYNFFKKK